MILSNDKFTINALHLLRYKLENGARNWGYCESSPKQEYDLRRVQKIDVIYTGAKTWEMPKSKRYRDKAGKKALKPVSLKKTEKTKSKHQDEIQVDFEFIDMKDQPSDYHAVKQFLNIVFGTSTSVNTAELADLITSSRLVESIGSVVKTEEDDSAPCGFATLLPLDYDKALNSLQKFLEGLKIPILNSAFIFNERFINLPSPIAVQLYKLILEDYHDAQPSSLSKKIQNIIISAPVIKFINETDRKGGDKFEHEYPEAEFLEEFSTFKVYYKVPSSHETPDSRRLFSEQGVEKWRIFLVLPFTDFPKYISRIQEFVAF